MAFAPTLQAVIIAHVKLVTKDPIAVRYQMLAVQIHAPMVAPAPVLVQRLDISARAFQSTLVLNAITVCAVSLLTSFKKYFEFESLNKIAITFFLQEMQ